MARDHHVRARFNSRKGCPNRPAVVLPLAPYVCPIQVSPWVPKPYRTGAISYLWPGFGSELEFQGRLIPCGYQSHQEAEQWVHLVVTHQIELDQAKVLAKRHARGQITSQERTP